MRKRRRTRPRNWVAKASCALAVPCAVVAISDLHSKLPQPFATAGLFLTYGILCAAVLVGAAVFVRRFVAPGVSKWLALSSRVAHLNPTEAGEEVGFYTGCMQRELELLDLSLREFARRAELSLMRAWALVRNPHIIPRPELWDRLERALLLPQGFLRRGKNKDGRKYGDECTTARLRWYMDRNLVQIHLKKNDQRMRTPRSRAILLRHIERELLRELNPEGGK